MYLRQQFQGDKEVNNSLIEHNLRLVVHIAKKYASNEQDLEDLTSIGNIGLIKAINSFKEEKGYKISTYASKCIDNEILMHIRATKKNQADVSMNTIIGTDKDGNDMELADTLVATDKDPIEEIYTGMLTKQIVKYINENLSEREIKIMNIRYGIENNLPKTQQEVADELNISRSYVSKRIYY